MRFYLSLLLVINFSTFGFSSDLDQIQNLIVEDFDTIILNGKKEILYGVAVWAPVISEGKFEEANIYFKKYIGTRFRKKIIKGEVILIDDSGVNITTQWIEDGYAFYDFVDEESVENLKAMNKALLEKKGYWEDVKIIESLIMFLRDHAVNNNLKVPPFTKQFNLSSLDKKSSFWNITIIIFLIVIMAFCILGNVSSLAQRTAGGLRKYITPNKSNTTKINEKS